MFSYYGSKSKVVELYPSPKFGKIIEPFAGSARYSLKYFDREVLLVDKYPVIVDLWNYLKQASEKDILSLPVLRRGDDIRSYKLSEGELLLLGFLVAHGVPTPRFKVSLFGDYDTGNQNVYKRIAGDLYKIRHWEIRLGSYEEIQNEPATWFIDPPYQFGGEHYKVSNGTLDYSRLAGWSLSRLGQVIVCENTRADWLPFYPMRRLQGAANTLTTEAIWSNYPHNFAARQASLFQEVSS